MSHTAELDEEERLLQEGIRLSLTEQESPDPATKSSATTKRAADKELTRDVAKRSRATPTAGGRLGTRMIFPNGAIRITRTPGRSRAKNCINLTDVIHKDSLVSACIFSFFIANEELFKHLPLSRSSNAVPVMLVQVKGPKLVAAGADVMYRSISDETQTWILCSLRHAG